MPAIASTFAIANPVSAPFDPAAHLLTDGPLDAQWTLVLAHGAGQGPRSPFMDQITPRLADGGLRVVRFAFRYMVRSSDDGRRRPPDLLAVLIATWRQVVALTGADPARLVIGGKSMGGRVASLIADEAGVAGLVCLGFPFHPPGQPVRERAAHLAGLRTPTLICQGERDPFGTREEVAGYALSPAIAFAWISDGEHSFKPRVRSGRTLEDNLEQAAQAVLGFVGGLG